MADAAIIGLNYCTKNTMNEDGKLNQRRTALVFPQLLQLTEFKRKIKCNDYFIDRDAITVIGSFSQKEIEDATSNYDAKMTTYTY